MKESFINIIGYNGLYQISSKGYIKSLDRVVNGKNGKTKLNGKILKSSLVRGYKAVNIWKNGSSKNIKIHRMIGLYFIENPKNLKCINHKNGIKTDNRIENLEWCTYSENLTHAYKNNLRFNKKAILQLDLKDNYIKEHSSLSDASKSIDKYYGRGNITKCCKGLRKSAYGYKWEYIN